MTKDEYEARLMYYRARWKMFPDRRKKILVLVEELKEEYNRSKKTAEIEKKDDIVEEAKEIFKDLM